MQFNNRQVTLSEIPSVEEIEFHNLDQNYLTVELIGLSLLWISIGFGVLINAFLNVAGLPAWVNSIIYALLIILIIGSYFLTIQGFKKKKYAVRERDIVYQRGLLWRKFTVLPFNRVQHAEVHQGPIERLFDLGKLKIYTAGGSSSDLSISGLKFETAQTMKHFVLHQTTQDEEE